MPTRPPPIELPPLPPSIRAVYAMARPRRPANEAQAVKAAAKLIGNGRSAQAIAADIARRVMIDVVLYLSAEDPMEQALAELSSIANPAPVTILARCEHIGTAQMFLERRMKRIAGRLCRQLSPLDFEAETRAVAAEVAATLARRYREHLAK